MKITVNGQQQEAGEVQTVAELVEQMGLGNAAVAVEVNREVVPKRAHAETTLKEGDEVEVVTLVGGG